MDRLNNTVRPYAWGSVTAIPELLGTDPTGEPQAELWMGAHPGAPSRVDRGAGPVPLDQVVAGDPDGELGPATVARFGPRLPFLLKVLAAAAPLSLQVHPDLDQARAGYRDEEERGVAADAPERNYKDANHKPELICALTLFEGLCGFRRAAGAADLFDGLGVDGLKPYADALRAQPEEDALREVFAGVLGADRDELAPTVEAAGRAAEKLGTSGSPYAADYAAYGALARAWPGDPGVIAGFLLNVVRLQPGEALFLGAGVPHAYLDGVGVEIMASSDNVLRCGLTPKHVDVPELLKIVSFVPGTPDVLRAGPDGRYAVPVDDFRLHRHDLDEAPVTVAAPADGAGPQILLCTDGSAELTNAAGEHLALHRGESAFVPAADGSLHATGSGTLFRATTAT
ncbi:mannose-6-phosphate isomerase, class I [Streptomyces sp. WMMC500]|uniref:mannose-6-phosphate isomerase, class I n=1 Tax=Streptomyces sp. WMMC500 TaxID=3015154 RepID=UPI00248B1B79|nr:mannose-6-phosphate isomerase, class I [Streptomyces sp. WMMC500]WBB58986.1 mannose-6-phosphate isomerase, class I [Streptomyces sp. WMMC500]